MPPKIDYVKPVELTDMLVEATGEDKRDIESVIQKYHEIIQDLLAEGRSVKLSGLFRLVVVNCKGGAGINNYGKRIQKKPYKKVKTVLTYALREKLGEEFVRYKTKDEEDLENGDK